MNSSGDGANGISRRPSKRQQEKAPEGQAPHTVADQNLANAEAGPAPVESRFTEQV